MKLKLALNFKDTDDAELGSLWSVIVGNMLDNEHFPDGQPLVNELAVIGKEYSVALAQSGLRALDKISYKNDMRAQLIKKLKELGAYVNKIANDSETILLASGFPVHKPTGEVTLQQPEAFKISPGENFGEMVLQVKRVPGARSYLYQYTTDPITADSVWQNLFDTRCKKVLTGLPLGVKLWFRMAAIGANRQIVYTSLLWRYVS